jgi:uncharacterized membrane protein
MIEKLFPTINREEDTVKRSIAKTISYTIVILILDFITIYWFTGEIKIAVGFMIISNVYTTVCFFFHERIWDKITWGKLLKSDKKE